MFVFNDEEILQDVEIYKYLPVELQHKIALYIDEVYNEIWNYRRPWYEIIQSIGSSYGFDCIVSILNNRLTEEEEKCEIELGFLHTCNAFITCNEKRNIGFYNDYTNGRVNRIYFWDDSEVDNMKATNLIMEKLNHYLYCDNYDPANMFQVNIRLLELYNNLIGYDDLYELED